MELIKVTERDGNQVVSARELHGFLESKQEFANWIKKRINEYGFVENEDYTSFDKIIKRENGATKLIEYALTLDMAKELAMVEKTEKGRQARKYFIAVEKMVREQHTQIESAEDVLRRFVGVEQKEPRVMLSLTRLITMHQTGLKTVDLFRALEKGGFVKRCHDSAFNSFWIFTERGLKYGETKYSQYKKDTLDVVFYGDMYIEMILDLAEALTGKQFRPRK